MTPLSIILSVITLTVVVGLAWTANRYFSGRLRPSVPTTDSTSMTPRPLGSKVLSAASYLALFSPALMAPFRRNADVYQAEIQVVVAVVLVGVVAAALNRLVYRRWI